MACDKYLELLSARLDGALSDGEERELEEHLASCPDCRALVEELKQLRAGFSQLEEIPAPENFAQGVMDRIRAEETKKKVIPLFKRPQFRALAGLAACLVLVVGIYGASRPRHLDETVNVDLTARSYSQDAQAEDLPMVNAALADLEGADAPQASVYSTSGEGQADIFDGTAGKSAPGTAVEWEEFDQLLTLERMPDGAEELMAEMTVAVFHDMETGADTYYWLAPDTLAAIEELAYQQGLIPGTSESSPAGERCALRILN